MRLKRGYDLPSRDRREGSIPILGSSGITGWHDEAKSDGPGVTIGRSGAIGVATYSLEPFWPLNTALYVADFRDNHPRYVYYVLDAIDFRSFNSGAAQPSLNRNYLGSIPVWRPDYETQKRISGMLGALDDSVENNRYRIQVLKEMARSLYQDWFVHRRLAGHEAVEAVDSGSSSSHVEWDFTTLGEAATWLSGGTPSTKVPEYWGAEVPWITSGSLTSFLLDSSDRMLTQLGAREGSRIVDRDTTLFVVRGMSLATEFRYGIADVPLAFGQDCKALVAKPGIEPLFLALSIAAMAEEILGMVEYAAHGTGKLSSDRIKALTLPLPPAETQRAFVAAVEPMRELMSNLRAQNLVLGEIRSILLPRLVSGDLDASDLDLEPELLGI